MEPGFSPSPNELALVNQIFAQADTQKIGILTGDVAVKVFSGSRLEPIVLGEIWSIADEENNGFLTKKGVAVALRLMGHAQSGEKKLDKSLLSKPSPLATIDGVQLPLVSQLTGASVLVAHPFPSNPPPLTPQHVVEFKNIFQSCGPVDGLLPGDRVLGVLSNSKLPADQLSRILALCNTRKRQGIDSTAFVMAMRLTQAIVAKELPFVPASLPPGWYEQASGGVVPQATGGSAHFGSPVASVFPPQLAMQPQATGPVHGALSAPPLRRPTAPATQTPAVFPFAPASQPPVPWDVTPAKKATSDQCFDTLDVFKRGYIEGEAAVPFMLQSNLSEDVLAQIWDLADINNDGRLTRDGLAIAMHLIHGKLEGKEIPTTLPPTLVPPSMRTNTAPPLSQAPEPMRDLLWDHPPPSDTQPQSALQPQSTGARALGFPASSSFTPSASQDPFSTTFASAPSSFGKDLLGDDDDVHTSPPLHDQSAEIGNVQNQLNSTNRALQTAQVERENLETTHASQAAQLSSSQTQLASAKASFETETTLLNTLRQRHAAQTAEIQKAREELIRAESDLSAVRVEKAELEGSFLREKEEVRELNRKMAEVSTQIACMVQEVEKVKKDANQQKRLLAVAREQFATKQSERAKVERELEEAQTDLADATKEREEAEVGVERMASPPIERAKSPTDSLSIAAAQPLPLTPESTGVVSPTTMRTNNPFEKLARSSASPTPRSQSPFRSFSTATAPTSSLPPLVTAPSNPFGIARAPEADQEPPFEVAPDNDTAKGEATPRAQETSFGDIFAPPTSDESFATPSGGTPVNQRSEFTMVSSPDVAAAHFPALDNVPEPQSSKVTEPWTDLSTDLLEIDVNGSDSDGDEEDQGTAAAQDREPRTTEVPAASEQVTPTTASTFVDLFGADAGPATKPEGAPSSTFPSAVDAFGVPLSKPSDLAQGAASGLDDVFGGTPAGSSAQPSLSPSFGAFDDDFAFPTSTPPNGAVAKPVTNGLGDLFSHPTSASSPVAPVAAAPHQIATSASLDDVFAGAWTTSQEAPQAEKTDASQTRLAGITFEEAFGGADALKLDGSFSQPRPPASATPALPPRAGKLFPSVSPPTSPLGIPSGGSASPHLPPSGASSGQSSSPHQRATSPPPRVASPKTQRSSTSSSRDAVQDKPAPPQRPKFMSFILKKKKAAPPVPPRVAPVDEQRGPPGSGDDVQPVKQLLAMGFGRDLVVAALETHDYDFQRALNSLLSAQ